MRTSGRPARTRGQILVMTAVLMGVLLSAVALVVHTGVLYVVRSRLDAAADAAATAAAAAVVASDDAASFSASAQSAAEKMFALNNPAGYWLTDAAMTSASVDVAGDTVVAQVAAQAAAVLPLLRSDTLQVSTHARAMRRPLDLVLVLDTSSGLSAMADAARTAAMALTDRVSPVLDRVSLVHFADTATVDLAIKPDFSRGFSRPGLKTIIAGLTFAGAPDYASALQAASDQLAQVPPANASPVRAVVFITGQAPATDSQRDQAQAQADALGAAGVRIFALGTGGSMQNPAWTDGTTPQALLQCMAHSTDAPAACQSTQRPTGSYCQALTSDLIKPCIYRLAGDIAALSR